MVKHLRDELTYQGLLTALRADIRRGHFPPGARLKVAELTKRYHTSAMPVRQALVELQSQGMISIPANRGASVRIVDEALLNNLCDLRKAVLGLLIRRFVERATPADIDQLERFEDAMDEALTFEEHAIANDLFFEQIDDVAANPEASDALNRTWPLLAPMARHFGPRDLGAISRGHRALIAAMRVRNADEAVAVALAAVEATRDYFVGKIRAEKAAEAAGLQVR
ncbi:MAG TPA: GntR family transcriptional regulator [Devosiaceae bacterium]|nr:GntR family transcriptional regulator [Devosiaceae bacterium]